MKKILALSLLILPLAAFAADDFGVTIPEWSDFAPPAFVNVKEPRGILGKLNVTAKYWYERKVAFEESLEACKAMEANDERFNCYEDLKVKQYKANSDYNARLEAELNPTIPEMQSKTDTMLPINGYFNNMTRFMPNEFQ